MKFFIQLPAQSAGFNTMYSVVYTADFDVAPGLLDPDTAYDVYMDYIHSVVEGRNDGLLPDPDSLTAVVVIGIDDSLEEEALSRWILSQHTATVLNAFEGNLGMCLGSGSFLGVDKAWFLSIDMTQAEVDAHHLEHKDSGVPTEVLTSMLFSINIAITLFGISTFEKDFDEGRVTWGRRTAEQINRNEVFAVWAEHENNAYDVSESVAPTIVDTYEQIEQSV